MCPKCQSRLDDYVQGEFKLIVCRNPLCTFTKTVHGDTEVVYDVTAPTTAATLKAVVKAIGSKIMARIG
ncbi:hypothetical protein E1281_05440 [Actinomadura sp. KC345]|uniref:hypothetical protein n=1 Tax=Actinomadura sp. KC345 TaxID=2530371 RepID=UPI0010480DEE|nr:hypothetical protein [Actinomadura sp. KC345]TDC57322.1 hypothetical protein E1281_05440 [Actinomadura sp. KC345]